MSDRNEISLSIEQTNKLRESLGLKPLKIEPTPKEKKGIHIEESNEDGSPQDEVMERLEKVRTARQMAEATRSVKTIAEEVEEEGDLLSWLHRQREEAAQKEESTEEGDGQDEEKQQEGQSKAEYRSDDLKGIKIKHGMKDLLKEGETVTLTMVDQSILNEKGDFQEQAEEIVLEEVRTREQLDREFVLKESQKKDNRSYDEHGNRRQLYEDTMREEEETRIGEDGIHQSRSQELAQDQLIQKNLQQGLQSLASTQNSDFLTVEETKFSEKKSKKKKKFRSKLVKQEEEEENEKLDYDSLELEAIDKWQHGNLGQRPARGSKVTEQLEQAEAYTALAAKRYEESQQKANLQSKVFKKQTKRSVPIGQEYDHDFLVLNNPLPNNTSKQSNLSAEKRLEEFSKRALEAGVVEYEKENEKSDQLVFQEIGEFARGFDLLMQPIKEEENEGGVEVKGEQQEGGVEVKGEEQEQEEKAQMGDEMEIDVNQEQADEDMYEPEDDQEEGPGNVVEGGWTKDFSNTRKQRKYRKKQENDTTVKENPTSAEDVEGITREIGVGKGLVSALQIMKSRGTLNQVVEWAGRTNDKKKSKLTGLDEVFKGGMGEHELERSIEVALAKKDQFGRILTPKEAFRELSYRFHGMEPSRNKIEKKIHKDREEMAIKKATTSDDPAQKIARMQSVHQSIGSAYIPFTGGQTPAPGMLAAAAVVAAPVLCAKVGTDEKNGKKDRKRKQQLNRKEKYKQKKQKPSTEEIDAAT
eukprot:TRINITY_DN3266_c0_g1_i1.p1 TRINITY_DN3266_c0_g1~~TRINITY_DN3266_c0_g1_i1.p1  ORF type:complete len:753 (-),score=205.44 TRINITY_DN3266_c0_g1_i1:512-2770(-)